MKKIIALFISLICVSAIVFANVTNVVLGMYNVVIQDFDLLHYFVGFFGYLLFIDGVFLYLMIKEFSNTAKLVDNKTLFLNKLQKYQKEIMFCYLVVVGCLLVSSMTSYFVYCCLFAMLALSALLPCHILIVYVKRQV